MTCRTIRNRAHCVLALVLLSAMPSSAQTQQVPERGPTGLNESAHSQAQLDSLIAIAIRVNPTVHAAQRRVHAAQARIGPAGALPDPMLSVGIMNLPIREPGFSDFITMKTVGAAQTLPFPGKRALAERTAELEVRAAGCEPRKRSTGCRR